MPQVDVVVIGLGAIGGAALHRLARRGFAVCGIDRHAPGHDRGSSHGETRMIRLGYFEHPSYVPLLRETYALWREIEAEAGRRLLHVTGIVEIGRPDGELVTGTLSAARLHRLPHERLDSAALMQRFPAFRVPSDFVGVWQPDGGFLQAEPAVETMVALARRSGAEVRTDIAVRAVTSRADTVRIETDKDTIEAGAAVVAAGPWIKSLLPDLPVRVTRQVMTWFRPRDQELFRRERFPVFLLESRHGMHYGFPLHGDAGVKIAKHHHADQTVEPDRVERAVTAADEALIRGALAEHIPAADGPLGAARTCLYTVTPDRDFIVDRLPDAPNIVVASACSGHGFKFAPVLGEILADLATDGRTARDIGRFRLARFG